MEGSKTRTRMKKEEREEQILEAARKVFVDKGYKGTTTLEIAQMADISEVTLFRYFHSKQEIFMKSIEPVLTHSLSEAFFSTNGLNDKERLENILKERIHFVTENYQLIKLILIESQLNNELPAINIIERITGFLREILSKMAINKGKQDTIIRVFMGALLSYLFMPETKEESVNDFVKQMVETIL